MQVDEAIVLGNPGITDRAARWACEQVGRHGRSLSEVADDLGCDWHTINRAVVAYGTALVDDPDRIGQGAVLGRDETAFVRRGRFRHRVWSTHLVGDGQLLDVVEGRDAAPACAWLADRPAEWIAGIGHVTLDLSGTYARSRTRRCPPPSRSPIRSMWSSWPTSVWTRPAVGSSRKSRAIGAARPIPLYRIRKLLIVADDRLDDDAMSRRQGLLAAGDPRGEVADAWTAKQAVHELYDIDNPDIVLDWVLELADSCTDGAYGPEIRRLGRTLRRWAEPITAWHASRATNGPVEMINNLAKRIKRVAFGLTNYPHWRIRVLLYAGKPDWSKLALITPARP